MRNLSALLLCAIALAGCNRADAPASSREPSSPNAADARAATETARFNAWLDARYEEKLEFSPIEQTMLGRKTSYDKIDEMSESAQDAEFAWQRQTVEELQRSFDYARLTPDGKLSYDVWVYGFERAAAALPLRRRSYVFSQMDGPHTEPAAIPDQLAPRRRRGDMNAYVARIRESARALDQALERARLNAGEGVRPPRFAYDAMILQARAVVAGAPFAGSGDSPLWADAQSKIAALAANGKIDGAQAATLRDSARAALTERLGPSYNAFIAWVETDRASSDEIAAGVWKLPDGAALYNERLAAATTTTLSAEEIHAIGLQEVARLTAEMEAAKERLGFAGSSAEFFAFVRSDARFYFPNDDSGREAYLRRRATSRRHKGRLPEFFGLLPKAGLVVKRVEAFRENPGAPQHYQEAPSTARARHLLRAPHRHERDAETRAPDDRLSRGHPRPSPAVSRSRRSSRACRSSARRASSRRIRKAGRSIPSCCARRWAAYEDVPPISCRLDAEICSAPARLVVDTGIHAKGWSENRPVMTTWTGRPYPKATCAPRSAATSRSRPGDLLQDRDAQNLELRTRRRRPRSDRGSTSRISTTSYISEGSSAPPGARAARKRMDRAAKAGQ